MAKKRRQRVIAACCLIIAVIALAIAAYFQGLWVPNQPSAKSHPIRGIDVSRHQGPIRWDTMSRDEVRFAYIKATEGGDFRDSRFAENWEASAKADIPRGAYHFFTMKTPGLKQAENFIATVPKDAETLPPAIDLEYWGNSSQRPPVKDFQRELDAFVAAIKTHYGREPLFYTANDFKNHYLHEYPIKRLWIRAVVFTPKLTGNPHWLLWQYSEKARVNGIDGFVDRNVFDGGEEKFVEFLDRKD